MLRRLKFSGYISTKERNDIRKGIAFFIYGLENTMVYQMNGTPRDSFREVISLKLMQLDDKDMAIHIITQKSFILILNPNF